MHGITEVLWPQVPIAAIPCLPNLRISRGIPWKRSLPLRIALFQLGIGVKDTPSVHKWVGVALEVVTLVCLPLGARGGCATSVSLRFTPLRLSMHPDYPTRSARQRSIHPWHIRIAILLPDVGHIRPDHEKLLLPQPNLGRTSPFAHGFFPIPMHSDHPTGAVRIVGRNTRKVARCQVPWKSVSVLIVLISHPLVRNGLDGN
mmetsp:Transcript_44628/g.69819  ORF Transcript_44628/g.69819 Transcript_44628/m.69819 type:complete len:202 (-) Transcript_44628:247-852(-)